ncbi:hypothetical protein KW794_01200 [Candidatus Saccharibacteria bacterium]|nr:hypothetical protein [Candidatus Saccharibacteria bacterium]
MVPLYGKFKKTYDRFKRTWLGRLFLSHRRRVAVSSSVSLAGTSLLAIAVMQLNVNASLANALLSTPMFFVGFFVVRKYAFADRETDAVPGLGKWGVKWLMTTPFSQPAYVWLVEAQGMHWLVAKVIVGAAFCLPSYTIVNLFVFARKGFGVKWVAGRARIFAIRVWTLGIVKA